MSQENVEVVRSAWRAWLRGQASEAFSYTAEDHVAARIAPLPDDTPYVGREGLLQIFTDWVEGFDQFEMVPQEFIDAGDECVVMRARQRAVGAQSRAPIEADFWFVHTMRGGKIARMDIYGSESQALEAVGLESRQGRRRT